MAGNIVPVPPDLPARLRKARERRYLTQAELAEKAGVHPRTVHELESGRRDRVLAKTAMLLAEALDTPYEEMLAGAGAGAGDATPPPAPPPRRRRLPVALAVAAVLAAVAVLAVGGVARYRDVRVLADTEHARIEARDGLFGRVLWRRDTADEVRFCERAPWSDDVLLVGLAGTTLEGGRLQALDVASGEALWSVAPEREEMAAAFGNAVVYGGTFHCRGVCQADLAGDGESELVVHFGHTKWYPNALCVVDRQGRRLAQYANKGSIYDVAVVDLDEDGRDEVLFAGTNNTPAYQGATVALLDADHWRGAAVDTFTQPGCTVPDSSRCRLLLPAWPDPYMDLLDIQRLDAAKIRTFRDGDGEIVIQVDVGAHGIGTMVLDMDTRLEPFRLAASDNFQSLLRRAGMEEDATARGILDPAVQQEWLERRLRFEAGRLVAGRPGGRAAATTATKGS